MVPSLRRARRDDVPAIAELYRFSSSIEAAHDSRIALFQCDPIMF